MIGHNGKLHGCRVCKHCGYMLNTECKLSCVTLCQIHVIDLQDERSLLDEGQSVLDTGTCVCAPPQVRKLYK